MKRQELIDSMVSCYDNGDAMLEYVEEYYSQRNCGNCIFLKISNRCAKGIHIKNDSLNIYEFSCNKWSYYNEG